MSKQTETIPITLVLTRYEIQVALLALIRLADTQEAKGYTSGDIRDLTSKISSEVRDQIVAFEDQNEEENPNPK